MEKNRKKILVTDTHLGIKKSNIRYLDIVKSLFEQICAYSISWGIDEMIHLGDFFDNRKHLSLTALDYATEIGNKVNSTFLNSYFILGNHDLFYKDKYFPTSHQVFNEYKNIHVISTPTVVDDILLVPWQLENDKYHPYAKFSDYNTRFCMGHFDVNGTSMGRNTPEAQKCRFSLSDFSQFEMTLSGHFHTIGKYPNNVNFIGSPYHMTFADEGPRGFYVWDDGKLEFIEFVDYPHYINLDAKDDIYDSGQIKDCVVKLTFNEDFGTLKNNEIIKNVSDHKPLGLFTNYKFDKVTSSEVRVLDDNIKLKGVRDIHIDFIDKSDIPEHLNKKTLVKLVTKLYDEYTGDN